MLTKWIIRCELFVWLIRANPGLITKETGRLELLEDQSASWKPSQLRPISHLIDKPSRLVEWLGQLKLAVDL